MNSETADKLQAQNNARTGLQMAMYQLSHDVLWRSKLAANAWNNDTSTGTGTYRFAGVDPVDGNIASGTYHPVVLTATGKSGDAVQRFQCQVGLHRPGISCLEAALHAESDMVFDNFSLTSDQFISTRGDCFANGGSAIYPAVKAGGSIFSSGGTYFGTNADHQPMRQAPDGSSVVAAYSALATAIPLSQLPMWDRNVVSNPGFESSTAGWSGFLCSLQQKNDFRYSGSYALRVSGRLLPSIGPYCSITSELEGGETYRISAWVYPESGNGDFWRIRLATNGSGSGSSTYLSNWTWTPDDQWTQVQFLATPTWTGNLTSATLSLESANSIDKTWFDDVTVKIENAAADYRAIHRKVLSPNSNPFGATTNALGIYSIDCQGSRISIKDSYLVGTLVLLNQHSESKIQGGVLAMPAVAPQPDAAQATYPLIVSNESLRIATHSNAFDEAQINANLNPTGSAYKGVANSTMTDTFPSQFQGLIYSAKSISFENSPTLYGMAISGDKMYGSGQLTVHYRGDVYCQKNAPAGFDVGPVPFLLPGSFKQVVD